MLIDAFKHFPKKREKKTVARFRPSAVNRRLRLLIVFTCAIVFEFHAWIVWLVNWWSVIGRLVTMNFVNYIRKFNSTCHNATEPHSNTHNWWHLLSNGLSSNFPIDSIKCLSFKLRALECQRDLHRNASMISGWREDFLFWKPHENARRLNANENNDFRIQKSSTEQRPSATVSDRC